MQQAAPTRLGAGAVAMFGNAEASWVQACERMLLPWGQHLGGKCVAHGDILAEVVSPSMSETAEHTLQLHHVHRHQKVQGFVH